MKNDGNETVAALNDDDFFLLIFCSIIQYSLQSDIFFFSYNYEGGSESSVIGVITLLIDMIGCCIIP